MSKPPRIPTLAEHLDGRDRGEGFEEFVAEILKQQPNAHSPGQQATLRVMRPVLIALVETLRAEQSAGRTVGETIGFVPEVVGYCMFCAVAGALHEDAPLRKVALTIADLMKSGAKRAAEDQSKRRIER